MYTLHLFISCWKSYIRHPRACVLAVVVDPRPRHTIFVGPTRSESDFADYGASRSAVPAGGSGPTCCAVPTKNAVKQQTTSELNIRGIWWHDLDRRLMRFQRIKQIRLPECTLQRLPVARYATGWLIRCIHRSCCGRRIFHVSGTALPWAHTPGFLHK